MLFGKKKAEPEPELVEEPPTPGKGRPTPKRKDAEAARRRPLVPTDRKAAARGDKEARRKQRDLEYQALQGTGDARYLPLRDQGPVRAFIRDYIDSRRSLSEYFLYVALGLMVGMIVTLREPAAALIIIVAMYSLFAVVIVENIFMTRNLKRRIIEKFGDNSVVRGTLMYAISRNTQARRLRMPKPKVQPGGEKV